MENNTIIKICGFMVILLVQMCNSCPDMCTCLHNDVDCRYSNFKTLPTEISTSVVVLDLSFNQLSNISWSFRQLKNLTTLNLSFNKIMIIDTGDIQQMKNLEILDLSHNSLHDSKEIKFSEFSQLPKLRELDLSHNDFVKIFKINSQSLKILKVNNCSLTSFNADIIQYLPNLEELYAENNKMIYLSNYNSGMLKLIDFGFSSIIEITQQNFKQLTALTTLILRNNHNLKKVEGNIKNLQFLNLEKCNLEVIPSGSFPTIHSVDLSGNHLRIITNYSFRNFTTLNELNLSHNAIGSVEPLSFFGLQSVRIIDLSFNPLTSINDDLFQNNTNLENLILSHAYISSFENFQSKSIRYLDLSNNEIRSLNSNSIIFMENLDIFNLSRNIISELPNHLMSSSLYTLDLSYCRITSINNKTFDRMPALRELILSGNRLTRLNPNAFPQVIMLKIADNPWRCDCKNLKDLFLWFQKSGGPTSQLICQSPEKFEGLNWEDVCINEWFSDIQRDHIWWYSIAIVISLVCATLLYVALRKMRKIKKRQQREDEETRRREDERNALRLMRQSQVEMLDEPSRNAPDPRELQRPPSYHDALLLPKLDASHPSLAGSLHSIASKHSVNNSNPDVSKKSRVRRKRRRRKSDSGTDSQRQGSNSQRASRATLDSDSSVQSEDNKLNSRVLESDF